MATYETFSSLFEKPYFKRFQRCSELEQKMRHIVGGAGTTADASVGLALALYTCLGRFTASPKSGIN